MAIFVLGFIIVVCSIVYLVYVLAGQRNTSEDSPCGSAPQMPLRRYYHETGLPPNGNYTVLDVETTGIDACTCEVLEIGAVRYRDHKEVERFHSLIRPEGSIPQRASDINGITLAKVCDAPAFLDVLPQFLSFLGEDSLIGYNIGFDIKFIQTRSGQNLKNPAFDVLPFVRTCIDLARYRLEDVKQHFGLNGGSHDAISDCLTTAEIFKRCLALPKGQEVLQEQEYIRAGNISRPEAYMTRDSSFDQGFRYWSKGEEARIQGDLENALHLFGLAQAAGYSASALYTSYAMAYRKLKDYEREISILDEALKRFKGPVVDTFQYRKSRALSLLETQKKREIELKDKERRKEQKADMRRRKEELEQSRPKRQVRRPVIQCTDDGTIIKEFGSISEAAAETGINVKCIRDAARGIQKHAGGHCWKFSSPDLQADS